MNQLLYQIRYALPIWFVQTLCCVLPDNRICIRVRGFLVSVFLPGSPRNFTLGRDVTLLGIDKLRVGNNVYIAKGCWINALGCVEIGDEVMFGPYVVVSSTKHIMLKQSVYRAGVEKKAIKIGKGSWIAAHCTVGLGSKIGKGTIVGANSFVTNRYPDDSFIAGVPAIVKKNILNEKN